MADENGNNHCLEGLQCPSCGNAEELHISSNAWFKVIDTGVTYLNESAGPTWAGESLVFCPSCGLQDTLAHFAIVPLIYEDQSYRETPGDVAARDSL